MHVYILKREMKGGCKCYLGAGGIFHTCTESGGRYMKSCHFAKVEQRSLLVQTVTSSAGPKHFQMSANTITAAGGKEERGVAKAISGISPEFDKSFQ